ncbi:MAG TPA: diacylglycerol kinase family protein [Trebonia sp.]|jgi:diacylglycerol kinase family enzyme|nr:diacylglycerol kinase family protein [Trebonia sp.]
MGVVAFIINGTLAGAGHRFRVMCQAAASAAGWKPEFLITRKAEDGTDAARRVALAGADLVVAVGGDGTVRCCAEGMAGTDVPMAIVPTGTANLLARTLAIPGHPRDALAVALGAAGAGPVRDRPIDLAIADGIPFTAMAGMGLDAAVVAGTHLKHQLGWLAYAVSGAAHLATAPATFTIRLDGGAPFTRVARCVVAGNSGLLPGGFQLLPAARLDDGLLDVGVLAPAGALGWARVATRVLTHSGREDRQLERFRARRVEITASRPLPREVDGEVVYAGPSLTVELRPRALLVRGPRRPHAPWRALARP